MKIAIVGGGPAGSSLAIRLAPLGLDVTLVEREVFPRQKLCGEFITPECAAHLAELGVLETLLEAGAEKVLATRFYDKKGRRFSIESGLFGGPGYAFSLSRAAMDLALLQAARRAGVRVLEGTRPVRASLEGNCLAGLELLDERGRSHEIDADLFVDATGRTRSLGRLATKFSIEGRTNVPGRRSVAVGFKNHLVGAQVEPGTCEMYSFRGGYAGLVGIEGGLTNLCCLLSPKAARRTGKNISGVLEILAQNDRARQTLRNATPVGRWLAVSIDNFGNTERSRLENLVFVGDAAAFIDPFTGSGMLMALESSALLANAIKEERLSRLVPALDGAYTKRFGRRLRCAALLRRLAFMPVLPSMTIRALAQSRWLRRAAAASTRPAEARRLDGDDNPDTRVYLPN